VKLKKLDNKTLRHKIYEILRESIISGEILPGQLLSLREIAEQFGVSIMPVREALWQLESEKVIVIESNKRILVSKLSPLQMEDILKVRLIIEIEAARIACDNVSDHALGLLADILESMSSLTAKPKKFLAKNKEFHFTLYAMAHSPFMIEILNGLWARTGPYFNIYVSESSNLLRSITCHKNILKALQAGDKEKIAHELKEDIELATNLIIPFL
jgi:DNA-binding GntR family transcriptional regulator